MKQIALNPALIPTTSGGDGYLWRRTSPADSRDQLIGSMSGILNVLSFKAFPGP
jgi:hypothetical protein